MIIPKIENATVTVNERNRIVVQANDGYAFYINDFVDEDGNLRDPAPDEISYLTHGVFSPTFDFTTIVTVEEEEI